MGDLQRKEQLDREIARLEAGEKPGFIQSTWGDWAWLSAIVVCGVVVWIALVKLGVAIVSAFL